MIRDIRFGLGAIGVGQGAVNDIIEERTKTVSTKTFLTLLKGWISSVAEKLLKHWLLRVDLTHYQILNVNSFLYRNCDEEFIDTLIRYGSVPDR